MNVFYDAKAAKKTAERKARRAARRLKAKGRGHRRSKSEGGKAGASAASGGDTTDGGATSGSEGELLGRPCSVHAMWSGQKVGAAAKLVALAKLFGGVSERLNEL